MAYTQLERCVFYIQNDPTLTVVMQHVYRHTTPVRSRCLGPCCRSSCAGSRFCLFLVLHFCLFREHTNISQAWAGYWGGGANRCDCSPQGLTGQWRKTGIYVKKCTEMLQGIVGSVEKSGQSCLGEVWRSLPKGIILELNLCR